MTPVEPTGTQIFISYGRQDALAFAQRLAADLEKRGGHGVWLDLESIESGALFEVRIEQGIRSAAVVAAVMTPHSVREESICRDEIVFALNEQKRIVPLRVHPAVKPTLLLARRNWIDFTADYEDALAKLLRYVEGDEASLRPPALPSVTGVAPLDFGPEIARFSSDFTGRKWLAGELDRWLESERGRALVIVGEPGVGKSAIAAWLSLTRPEAAGVHFCTHRNSRSLDPYEFVASLVGQLHARLPGYGDLVEERRPHDRRPRASDAFRELLVEPARALAAEPRIVIVDALDEALAQAGETILDVLVDQARDLPSWLRIVATTRPEARILDRIRALDVFTLAADRPENREDLRAYTMARLGAGTLAGRVEGRASSVAERLEALSEGNFLYLRLGLDALEQGNLSETDLGQLSVGLAEFYGFDFRRRFRDTDVFERSYAPLLRVLAAARSPLSFSVLERIGGEAESVHRRLRDLRAYVRVSGSGDDAAYSLYHKSLTDWLTDRDAAGDFWCSAAKGHAQLVDVLLENWRGDEYALRYLPAHLIEGKDADRLADLLTDLRFVEAKCARDMTYDLVADYRSALALLETARDRSPPSSGDVPPSATPWTEEQIASETTRLQQQPGSLVQLRAFAQFVDAESHNLAPYGFWPGYAVQQAQNAARGGPVHEAAKRILREETFDRPILRMRWSSLPSYTPRPALVRTLEGHREPVSAIALTPDGRLAVSGSLDMELRVWDVESGRCLKRLPGHSLWVTSVAVSPDGRSAISGSGDRSLMHWNLEAGECVRTLTGHSTDVLSVAISSDGKSALSGGADRTVRLWDLDTGLCLKVLSGHDSDVKAVALAPDGRFAFSADASGTMLLWDVASGASMRRMEAPHLASVAVSSSFQIAVAGSWESSVQIWDLSTGSRNASLDGHQGAVSAMAISADGKIAFSGGVDKTVRVWWGGKCLRTLHGHAGSVDALAASADGRWAVSGGADKTLRIWDVERGQSASASSAHSGPVTTLTVTADGKKSLSGGLDGTVRVWGARPGEYSGVLRGHSGYISTVALSRYEKRAVSASADGTLSIWDLETGRHLRTLQGHAGKVHAAALSPDGRRAVSAGEDKSLRVWELETGRRLSTLTEQGWSVYGVVLTASGRLAVSRSYRVVALWDLSAFRRLRAWQAHASRIHCMALTPDDRSVITGSTDETLGVWSVASGRLRRRFRGHRSRVTGVAVAPHGRRVVSVSREGLLFVWDLQGGELVHVLRGHARGAVTAAFTLDGRYVLSGGEDKTIRLSDVETGSTLAVASHPYPITALVARSDGFVVGDAGGHVSYFAYRNVPMEPPWVTPARLFSFDAMDWQDHVTAPCPHCGLVFETLAPVLEAVARAQEGEDSPCETTPAAAWDDPRLRWQCPSCERPIRFNPFLAGDRVS